MNYLKKNIFLILISAVFLIPFWSVEASTTFSFRPVNVDVKEGQKFRLFVDIDPHGVKNYTVKTSIKFPPELVAVNTWNYSPDWMPIRKSEYDYFNNDEGLLIRTAGFPAGFNGNTNLGYVDFIAKKNGIGVIIFSGEELALNGDNLNTYESGNAVNVTVRKPSSKNVVTSDLSGKEDINVDENEVVVPKQLFDIDFDLDQTIITSSDELVSRVSYTSFGNVPTLVEMTFVINDESGKEVYREKNEITVETEKTFEKRFPNIGLPLGKYEINLETLYNTDVRDKFVKKFEILASNERSLYNPDIVVSAVLILVVVLGAFMIFRKRQIRL